MLGVLITMNIFYNRWLLFTLYKEPLARDLFLFLNLRINVTPHYSDQRALGLS
jgi:hypothetical protein